MRKYPQRYKNRVRGYLHKLTTDLARGFKDYEHGFEDLDKQRMFNVKNIIELFLSKIGNR